MKSLKNRKNKIGLGIGIASLFTFTVVLNVLSLTWLDNILEQYFGVTPSYFSGETLNADTTYVKSDFSSVEELYKYEEQKCSEIAQDGIVLLQNNDNLLPLNKGKTLSLFSHSSVDLVSGGSGSGSGSFELTKDLKEGLEKAGLKVNEKLWNFYKNINNSDKKYVRGVGSINYGADLDWSINEVPLNVILKENGLEDSFKGTTAMFVLSRTGGEGADESRDMLAFGGKAGTHYLEPDETELEIIKYLNDNFDDVILLVNCNNAMELGWVSNYPNIKSVVNFPGPGRTGTYGLGYMLTGLDARGNEISPSGHLVDTFVYDNFSSPAMQNMGDFRYEDTNYYYVAYNEGIYVGYKYYETRYEDVVLGTSNVGNYNYDNTVHYPFGYGLSYTDFAWSNYSVSAIDSNKDITISLNVKNVGSRTGKEVVQIYAQTPYSQYDIDNQIEKSAVQLVGFAKTKLLKPQEEVEVQIKVNAKELISYDAKTAKTYILEDGTYYLTAGKDAHEALNNILLYKRENSEGNVDTSKMVKSPESTELGASNMVGKYVQTTFDKTTYSTLNNTKIENQFDHAVLKDQTYLSRSNWNIMENNGLRYGSPSNNSSRAEINGKQFSHPIDPQLKSDLDSKKSLNPKEGTIQEREIKKSNKQIDLIDLRGLDYNDPLWDELLSQISVDELHKLVCESGYCTPKIDSINKPKVTDLDGPAGLNKVVGHGSVDIGDNYLAMTWPTEYMLACTWDATFAYEMGVGIGEDGLYGNVQGWYGPGMNIHRTPFAGRNFEYYSEDSFLSGIMAREEVKGASSKGMYAFIKHFALNDQETHRDHLGLVTWANEQSIREIYLKPFEMCIVDNYSEVEYNQPILDEEGNIISYERKKSLLPATFAVMTSFNRIGATWAGGNYNLLTNVLRKEWGFNGFVLTDYEVRSYMHTDQSLAAGGDAKLTTVDWGGFSLKKSKEHQYYAYDAAHHILYTVVNSSGMNGYVHGVKFVNGFAYYKIILISWDVIALASLVVMGLFLYKNYKKEIN